MNSDIKTQCADMILADVIQDASMKTGESADKIRNAIIASAAYDALYDFETNLWQEGPDYFAAFAEECASR